MEGSKAGFLAAGVRFGVAYTVVGVLAACMLIATNLSNVKPTLGWRVGGLTGVGFAPRQCILVVLFSR